MGIFIYGVATMNLYDCSPDHAGCISGNPQSSGTFTGGIYNDKTFVMYGGTISGHVLGAGGGIYNNGTVIMNNGVIENNNSRVDGGGVYNKGDFKMNGGSISGNVSTSDGAGYVLPAAVILQ